MYAEVPDGYHPDGTYVCGEVLMTVIKESDGIHVCGGAYDDLSKEIQDGTYVCGGADGYQKEIQMELTFVGGAYDSWQKIRQHPRCWRCIR
jgi:hypothetical protein